MTRVTTGARLHFGLFNPAAGPGERRFGGAGLMIDGPETRVRVEPASEWSAEGPQADRALAFARRVAETLAADGVAETLAADGGVSLGPQRVIVESAAPPHCGLGSGTQLGLAVARALAGPDVPAEGLARLAGRGERSGVGVHGFERGGFLVDAGQSRPGSLAPLVARVAFPEDWRVVLVLPETAGRWHGERERRAFEELTAGGEAPVAELCRLALLGMLPALVERDLEAFGEALYEFNRRAGEVFAAAQGGLYAGAEVAELVQWLRGQGIRGAGQSSWGPTVFGLVGGQEEAGFIARQAEARKGAPKVIVSLPCNRGAHMATKNERGP